MNKQLTADEARKLTSHRDVGMSGKTCDWKDCRNLAHYAIRLSDQPHSTELRTCSAHMDDVRLHVVENGS